MELYRTVVFQAEIQEFHEAYLCKNCPPLQTSPSGRGRSRYDKTITDTGEGLKSVAIHKIHVLERPEKLPSPREREFFIVKALHEQ